jgi:hypothetical protein
MQSAAQFWQRAPWTYLKETQWHAATVLVEAAHLAPRFNEILRAEREREIQKGGKDNKAVIAVARKLVRYLLAINRLRSCCKQSQLSLR